MFSISIEKFVKMQFFSTAQQRKKLYKENEQIRLLLISKILLNWLHQICHLNILI